MKTGLQRICEVGFEICADLASMHCLDVKDREILRSDPHKVCFSKCYPRLWFPA